MPNFNIDLCDGLPPVCFSLNERDSRRFMDFMAECHAIRRADPNYRESIPYSDPRDED